MSAGGRVGQPEWRADLALLVVVLIWGFNIPVMKSGLSHLHPFAFNMVRLGLSAVLLGALDAAERRRRGGAAATAAVSWRRVVALSLVGSLLYQVLFVLGMHRTTAGNTGLLVGTVPLWTALIATYCGIERIRRGAWMGLAAALAGTVVIAAEGGDVELAYAHLGGNLLVLTAMVAWAAFAVMSKPVLAVMSPIRLAFLTSLISLPGHAVLALPHVEPLLSGQLSASAWGSMAYAGLLSTGLAYALWNYGVRQLGPSHTAIYNNMVPVLALAASWLTLGEAVAATQIAGGTLIVGGLVVLRRTR